MKSRPLNTTKCAIKNIELKPSQIYTDRHFRRQVSQQIVYEWEDELASSLSLRLKKSPLPKNRPEANNSLVYSTFKRWDSKIFKGRLNYLLNQLKAYKANDSFYFEMYPKYYRNFSNSKKVIPIIVDFWDRNKVAEFNSFYQNCPCLLVTSLEVLHFLKRRGNRNKLVYFPLSLPTKYKLIPDQVFEKKFDIVLAGRVNHVLMSFLKKYERIHPEIEYVFRDGKNEDACYRSNQCGELGKIQSRSDYFNLIRAGRISFYSTPGMDGGETRTNGFNPVTPRFFELLAAGCHILARYPNTAETSFFRMDAICPSINTFEKFEYQLDNALQSSQPIKRNAEYLKDHYTENRIDRLRGLI
jgi:hypothetical protein